MFSSKNCKAMKNHGTSTSAGQLWWCIQSYVHDISAKLCSTYFWTAYQMTNWSFLHLLAPCYVHSIIPHATATTELQGTRSTVQVVWIHQMSDLPVQFAGLVVALHITLWLHTSMVSVIRTQSEATRVACSCWCYKQASKICYFVPVWPWRETSYHCSFFGCAICWIWVLFWRYGWNPCLYGCIHRQQKIASMFDAARGSVSLSGRGKFGLKQLSGCVQCPRPTFGNIL